MVVTPAAVLGERTCTTFPFSRNRYLMPTRARSVSTPVLCDLNSLPSALGSGSCCSGVSFGPAFSGGAAKNLDHLRDRWIVVDYEDLPPDPRHCPTLSQCGARRARSRCAAWERTSAAQ